MTQLAATALMVAGALTVIVSKPRVKLEISDPGPTNVSFIYRWQPTQQ